MHEAGDLQVDKPCVPVLFLRSWLSHMHEAGDQHVDKVQLGEVDARMVGAILAGVRRAFPFVASDSAEVRGWPLRVQCPGLAEGASVPPCMNKPS